MYLVGTLNYLNGNKMLIDKDASNVVDGQLLPPMSSKKVGTEFSK